MERETSVFTIAEDFTYRWPVLARVPQDGGYRDHQFSLDFRAIAVDRQLDLAAAAERGDRGAAVTLLTEVVAGWGDEVRDAAGVPLPFTPENLKRLLAVPGVAMGVVEAYRQSQAGEAFREKNSGTPRADGPAAAQTTPTP